MAGYYQLTDAQHNELAAFAAHAVAGDWELVSRPGHYGSRIAEAYRHNVTVTAIAVPHQVDRERNGTDGGRPRSTSYSVQYGTAAKKKLTRQQAFETLKNGT